MSNAEGVIRKRGKVSGNEEWFNEGRDARRGTYRGGSTVTAKRGKGRKK